MISENKTVLSSVQKSQSSHVKDRLRQHLRRQSFDEVCDYVREQIEIDCFSETDRPFAENIAAIIAEVLILPEDAAVRISGYDLTAQTVARIFLDITHERVAEVMANFRKANYEIKHIKTYLRTALYNSFFEFEAHADNFANRC